MDVSFIKTYTFQISHFNGYGRGWTFESINQPYKYVEIMLLYLCFCIFLQASLTLYQSEIKTFKNLLEQMHAEREKLKCHVTDANNRATLLAQEVDDNHSRMEQNTLNQVKLLEQRHSDILKEITGQFTKDKDQLTSMNQILEEKISSLEQEVNKLKNDLLVAQKYSLNVEKENQNLSLKIAELERDKNFLSGQIDSLENEKQKTCEIELEETKMLMTKLATLQMENAQLKDKNDEMVSEIESLSTQVSQILFYFFKCVSIIFF